MNVVIIEDEKPAQDQLVRQLKEVAPSCNILAKLDSIKTSVQWLETHEHPDLFFMDIQLADGLSFSIFDRINITSPIIFCTAYDEYALKAFKVNSIDYLLKPIESEELKKAIQKYESIQLSTQSIAIQSIKALLSSDKQESKKRFMVKVGEKIKAINVADISFFWSEQKASYLQTIDGKKSIIDYTLDEIYEMIDHDSFFKLNRKYITSIDAIEEVFSYSNSRLKIHLKNCPDKDILISREKVKEFKDWLDA